MKVIPENKYYYESDIDMLDMKNYKSDFKEPFGLMGLQDVLSHLIPLKDYSADTWLDKPDSVDWYWFHGSYYYRKPMRVTTTKPTSVWFDGTHVYWNGEPQILSKFKGKWLKAIVPTIKESKHE